MKLSRNEVITIALIVLFLVLGLAMFQYGIKNGQQISIELTKPADATFWSTSPIESNLVMIGICSLGGLWIIVAHVLFILLVAKKLIYTSN